MAEEEDLSAITDNTNILLDEDSNKLKEIKELLEERKSLLNKMIEKINNIKKESEETIKSINCIPKEKIKDFLNIYDNEKEYQDQIKNFCDKLNNILKSYKKEKKFSSSHRQFDYTSKLEQENENFIEMKKINNSKVAIRSDNLIIIKDIFEKKNNKLNSFKASFGEKKIIYFCSYQTKSLLVSLKTKADQYFINLIDLEKEMNYELENFENEISYIAISTNSNQFYVIEKPNILISFKNEKINNRVTVQEINKIDLIIEINYNVLFCVNEYGYFIFDIENNTMQKQYIGKEKKFVTKNLGHIQNFIIINGFNYVYVIEIGKFEIISKVGFPFDKCYFCDNAPFVCFIKNNKISIYEFIPQFKNLLLKKERNYPEENIINSIVFNGPEQLLLFTNGQFIQIFYLINK